MTSIDRDVIVEQFRGAAMGLVNWTSALDTLARATGARIGQLAAIDRSGAQVVNLLSGTSADEIEDYVVSGGPDPSLNPRTRAVLMAPEMRCISESDFATPELIDRTPIYTGLFRRGDVPYSSHIRLESTPGLITALSMLRPRSSGHTTPDEVRLIEAVAPGVSSAVKTGIAIGAMMDRMRLDTAEQLSGPTVLLGSELRVVSMSPEAEQLVRRGQHLRVRLGRLVASDDADTAALQNACRSVRTYGSTARGSMPVALRAIGMPPLHGEVHPLPIRLPGGLSTAHAMLTVNMPRRANRVHTASAAKAAFGLTEAESEIAALLTEGNTLQAVADRRGTSLATVRSQVKTLLAKTGTHRQAEMVLRIAAL